jgi:hypothetical protein
MRHFNLIVGIVNQIFDKKILIIKAELSKLPFNKLLLIDDIDEMWNLFKKLIIDCIDKVSSLKNLR